MNRALFSGVSGLKSHQTRMDVIGNNIANINTVGFKSSRTTFSDMLSQLQRAASSPTDNLGGINPRQIGLGAAVESIDLIFTDASPQQTGKNTDLALSGNGLFVLKNGDQSYYTRDGAFEFDEDGQYVLPGSGLRVQGWNAVDGVITTSGLSEDIVVPVGKTMEAAETTTMSYSGNLNANSPTITRISYTRALGGSAEDVSTTLYITPINYNGEVIGNAYTKTSYAAGGTLNSEDQVTVGKVTPVTTTAEDGTTTTTYNAILKDAVGNTVGTITGLTERPVFGATFADITLGNSTRDGAYSVNVDTENILSATLTLSDGSTRTVTSGYYEIGKSIPVTTLATVYDSEGNQHQVSLLLDKDTTTLDNLANDAAVGTGKVYDDNGNQITSIQSITANKDENGNITSYSYTYRSDVDGSTQSGQTSNANQVVFENRWRAYLVPQAGLQGPASPSYNNSFTQTESDGSTAYGVMNPVTNAETGITSGTLSYVYFNNKGAYIGNGRDDDAAINFSYADGNGSAPNTATITFDGLTQYANNTTAFPTTDGNTSGVLQSVAIDGSGIITGTYTNGLIRQEAQIAVAQFANNAGLTKVGTTIYQESNNSGAANIRTIADFGLTVISSALEMSNVDLATEFSEMIITQRGFQANSKMTTVSDEMLETVVNMKR